MPPRPNSVPNQATASIHPNSHQCHPDISSHELESNHNSIKLNESESYSSPRRIEQPINNLNCPSVGGVRNTTNLKTHGEIYQQFAAQIELNNIVKLEEYECSINNQNENNNASTDQDLHFAKRLTWNLSDEDKMQTSTDGMETPIVEQNNMNINENSRMSSLYNQGTKRPPNFSGKR